MNIHRYTVKLGYDNSLLQLINAFILIIVFILSRTIFGQYTAFILCRDLWRALTQNTDEVVIKVLCSDGTVGCTQQGPFHINILVVFIHLTTNLTFAVLNWYWLWGITNLLKRRISRWRGVKVENGNGNDYYPPLKDLLKKGKKSKE